MDFVLGLGAERHDGEQHRELKRTLHRIFSVLTRLIDRTDGARETHTEYNAAGE